MTPSLSAESVRRILRSHQRKPWRKRMWLSPKVPHEAAFAASVRRICELYTRPLEPNERVICADEHTSLQPRPRLAPTRPALPERPVQVEHEACREGALNLLAAFDPPKRQGLGRNRSSKATGRVSWAFGAEGRRLARHGDAGLSRVGQCADAHGQASVGLVGKASRFRVGTPTRPWLVDKPDRAMVFDFGLQAGSNVRLLSKAHLQERLEAFIREWNPRAHGFNWLARSCDKIVAKCEQAVLKAA